MKNNSFKFTGLFLFLLLATAGIASAHAYVDHADPKVGADIDKPPGEVKIWFTEEVEPDFSAIEVYDSDGKQVDKKDTHLDSTDKTLLIVSLENLPPGTYKVVWHVVASDTHKTKGDFKFVVKPQAATSRG